MAAFRRRLGAGLTVAAVAAVAMVVPADAPAAGGQIRGTVPMAGMNVVLMAARPGKQRLYGLGFARSRRGGSFSLRYQKPPRGSIKYLLATRPRGAKTAGFQLPANAYRLAAALGAGAVPRRAAINERTTVALSFAMAQFVHRNGRIAGENPGLRNAAAMTRNLVGRRGGGLSPVLRTFPNGRSTTTLATVNSLANLVAACRLPDWRCARLLRYGAAPGSKAQAPDTLTTMVSIARNPWHDVRSIFRLSQQVQRLYRPALTRKQRIPAWTLALRFEGSPPGMDGPGNFAIDARGNLWVGNNYEYSRQSKNPTCFGRKLFRFTPTGRYFPGSPYESGGTSGVGFGITIDKNEHVWVGNFGFEGKGCRKEAPHNSVSEYAANGKALSPELSRTGVKLNEDGELVETFKGGWEVGEIFWPQATVADVNNNIWVANCGNNSVTTIPNGEPKRAVNYPENHFALPGGFDFSRPFGAATDAEGNVYVGGNESATVVKIGPNGEVLDRFKGGGLHRPLGLATDSRGNVWVSNSTWVVAPCVGTFAPQKGPRAGGSVTLIKSNGKMPKQNPFEGGGIKNAWGIAVDGADNIWVANFSGRRLSQLCGTRPENCPAGKRRTGTPISPGKTGYRFDGLVRNTGVAIDPSGNVWLANNWKNVPIQTNPGGYQIVAFLGAAAPIKTPLIGPPERP